MRFIIIILTLILAAGNIFADVIQFPITGTTGPYPIPNVQPEQSYGRVDSITYSGPTAIVRSISLHLIGFAQNGLLECCNFLYNCPDTTSYQLESSGMISRLGESGFWYGGTVLWEDGMFDLTKSFTSWNGFTTLVDGDIFEVKVYLMPAGIAGTCNAIPPIPNGTVDEAYLIFDIDYVIPVRSTSWGEIKALYGEAN